MDIKNLLFNMLLAGLTSYIISNLFFYFVNKDKKNKFTVKEKTKEKKAKEKTEEEEHKESKEKIFDCFKNGVPYSEKEYEALNKFLDGLQLIGLKFLYYNGYIEVTKEYDPFNIYGFIRNVYITLDRVKGCLKISNWTSSTDYRYRTNCEKIQPLIDRFNKTMGYEEEVEEDKYVDKEEQIKNILDKLSRMDPKKEKGYLDLEKFIRGAFDLGYQVSLGIIDKTINLGKRNKQGKDITIIVWYDPDRKELTLSGQFHRPYEIEKEMREVRWLVQKFNNEFAIYNIKPKEESNTEGTQKKYPNHYYINGKNTIEIIKDIVNKNAKTVQEGIDLFNVLKYLIRYRNKNKVDDLQKAKNYLDWLIKEVEEQELSTLNGWVLKIIFAEGPMQEKEFVVINGEKLDKKQFNIAMREEKESLGRLIRLARYIESKEELEEELKELNGSIGGIDYSKERVQTSGIGSFENLSIKLIDLRHELFEKKGEYIFEKNKLLEKLVYVKTLQARVIELRYIDRLEINDIAGDINRTASRTRILLKEGVMQLAVNNMKGFH